MIGEIRRNRSKHRLAISLPVASFPDFPKSSQIATGPDTAGLSRDRSSLAIGQSCPVYLRKLAKAHSAKVILTSVRPKLGLLAAWPAQTALFTPVSNVRKPHSPMHRRKVQRYRLAVDYNTGVRLRLAHNSPHLRALLHKATLL